MNTLPDEALLRISACLKPVDRLNMQLCCKRFRDIFSKWKDIYAIDIRFEDYGYGDILQQARCSFQIVSVSKNAKASYRIRLTDFSGSKSYRLRTNLEKYSSKALKHMLARLPCLRDLTIWDCCLSDEFSCVISRLTSVSTLRIWNCSLYFDKKNPSKRLLSSLFSLPDLDTILILDSTPQFSSRCKAELSRSLADCIKGPIKNLQIAGLYIPWRVLDCLCEKLRCTLKRLAIGCTYGKETRRDRYVKALSKLEKLEDVDIPPHIFHLSDSVDIDPSIGRLFNRLPLTSLGFRHYNSAVLFRYIEFRMPHHIRLLRIHHNVNRVPNFAQLGVPQLEEKPAPRKSSWLSSRQSVLGSKHSILSASTHSIASGSTELSHDLARRSSSASDGSDASQTTIVTSSNERKISSSSLITRHLTIFAIEESARKSTIEKAAKLRRHHYSGVEVFYVQETLNSQEVLGRMAAPMQSPHVYSKSAKREVRVIKGDLVRPIPLASLGMESDYEMTDWED
ncbi:hypothetical protein Tcan_08331 [Toxocara canis]|uniref:F-box domain-containing protein n=2 Tax=Toxocara canis TaxID=6265 RepID=A0A0B2VV99_TOXCA|nr:hypothetical protein Tcan_08331 [Toxocara canis]VDM37932.1 unnamed protein product [Toxocara canis]